MEPESERYLGVVFGGFTGRLIDHYGIKQIDTVENRRLARGIVATIGEGIGLGKAMGKLTDVPEWAALAATSFGTEQLMNVLTGPEGMLFKAMYTPETASVRPEIYTKQIANLRAQVQKLNTENSQLKAMYPSETQMPVSAGDMDYRSETPMNSRQMESEMGFM